MDFVLLGWPPDAPTLRLDHRRFAYAGKFVRGSTGTAVARRIASRSNPGGDDEFDRGVLAAASFNADRTDADRLVVRYVTVRDDRRGEGLGSRLLAFVAARADDRGYARVRIAVNNPAAYRAAYRAGFAFAGTETGLAELVCERPAAASAARDPERYRAGLARFRERDLSEALAARLDDWLGAGLPSVVGPPPGVDADGERVDGGRESGG
jgi:GNAT superfamily N-acetyltransferase